MFWLSQLYIGAKKKKEKETYGAKIPKIYHAYNFSVSSVQVKWHEKPRKPAEAVLSCLCFSFVCTYSAQSKRKRAATVQGQL